MDFYSKFVNLLVDFTVFICALYVIISIPMAIRYAWKTAGSLDMFLKYFKEREESKFWYQVCKENLVQDLQWLFVFSPGFIIGNLFFIKVMSGV